MAWRRRKAAPEQRHGPRVGYDASPVMTAIPIGLLQPQKETKGDKWLAMFDTEQSMLLVVGPGVHTDCTRLGSLPWCHRPCCSSIGSSSSSDWEIRAVAKGWRHITWVTLVTLVTLHLHSAKVLRMRLEKPLTCQCEEFWADLRPSKNSGATRLGHKNSHFSTASKEPSKRLGDYIVIRVVLIVLCI